MVQIDEVQTSKDNGKILVAMVTRAMAKREKGKMAWDEQEEVRRNTLTMLAAKGARQESVGVLFPTEG